MKNLYKIEDELYIISDNENINENNYIITKDGRLVQVSYLLSKDLEGASKVILTTNDLLIKNGVQAVDDNFLEWFVKNPSCELIGFEKEQHYQFVGMSKLPFKPFYKIIIPKEEDKNICIQTGLPCGMQCLSEEACNSIRLKQETLEEAKKYAELSYYGDEVDAFVRGANWMQERMSGSKTVNKILDGGKPNIFLLDEIGQSNFQKFKLYNEEEVEDLIYKVCGTVARLQGITLNGNHIDTAYKQFKKK